MQNIDKFGYHDDIFNTRLRYHIAVCDGNKFGRMSDDELNDQFSYFKNVINKDSSKAIAAIIVPTLPSIKRKRGDRDERARIERKADAKQMDAHLCQLYMSMKQTHGNDGKQRSYNVYVLFSDDEDALGDNPFMESYMVQRGGTATDAEWIDPSSIYMPVSHPGGVTVINDLSVEKRVAQLLGGQDVPRCLINALLTTKTGKPLLSSADVVVWSHWTPLDGCFEMVVRQEAMKPDMPMMHCFSASTFVQDVLACKARLLSIFLKDWKLKEEKYIVGEVVRYSHEIPEMVKKEIGGESAPPKLHLCKWVAEAGRDNLSLPDEIRKRWVDHPVYGEQWRNALKAFTKATKSLLAGTGQVPLPADTADDEACAADEGDWAMMSEGDIRAQHDIEKEFATEFPNIVFLVARSKKLFAVARGGAGTIAPDKNVFHHGVGDWTKPPNAEKLLTKDSEDKCQTFNISSDSEHCVLEIVPDGGRTAEDTDATAWGDFLRDLEDNGMASVTVFGHKYSRPEGAMDSTAEDHFMIECTLNNSTHWVWKPRAVPIQKATAANIANLFPIDQLLESKKAGPRIPVPTVMCERHSICVSLAFECIAFV